ncbi:MAG: RNA polymerase sigma factor [bacterium]
MKKMTGYTDEELIALLDDNQNLSERAFQELYNRYSSMVHAYCMRVLNDQELAEDFFQDTFIRFFQHVKASHEATNVPGFLITIARNLLLNYKRDKRTMVSLNGFDVRTEKNQNYENRELLELITYAMDLLDFEYREAFVLREYDGLPYTEIAEITGTTLTNAKSRVFRAKQKIKEVLQPYLQEFI